MISIFLEMIQFNFLRNKEFKCRGKNQPQLKLCRYVPAKNMPFKTFHCQSVKKSTQLHQQSMDLKTDFRFSWKQVWRWLSSGMLHHVVRAIITLIMKAASTSEILVHFYQTTQRNIPEDRHCQYSTILYIVQLPMGPTSIN
jgi:hypothetical protein